ncbi:cytochrome P450 81C13-like isoform X1 [Rhododendron vialii]|uniref:cytochrome P450 81C13-like isoform X1 n=1 Tax=Rhododendron vialii TaxID=182163 RepID=UPI00265F25A4|nr:cytochrome P450 81C13-like isoform X1 [Rhododendron vialii]
MHYLPAATMAMDNYFSYSAFLLPLLLFILAHFLRPRSKKLPPGPFPLPVIGHLHLVKTAPHEALSRLSSKHGPILFLWFGSRPTLVLSSPSAVEECFARNDVAFANRPPGVAADNLTYNYTSLVWAPYGHLWRTLRRLIVVELFSAKSLQKSSVIREEETRNFLSHLGRASRASRDGDPKRVELKYWFFVLTVNTIMRVVNGERYVGDEDAGGEAGRKLVEGFEETFMRGKPLNLCDYFPVLRWVDYQGVEKSMRAVQGKRDGFLQGLVDEFRRKREANCVDDYKSSTLIGTLLRLQESEPEFYTEDVIKSVILVLFLGGIGSSTSTMERAISLLLNHPEALRRVRTEIDTQVGHSRLVDDTDFAVLPFLHCVICETLRLHPPLPLLLPHYSSEDCTVGGFDVPRGTTLLVNAWAVHRDPNVWEQPNNFKPERFEAIEKEREGFKFVPFGVGRRACPGNNMAMRAISLAIGALIQCFELEKVGGKKRNASQLVEELISLKFEDSEAVCFPRQEALGLLSQFEY